MASHIYLIRHGETDWNKNRRIQGQLDVPLNETGLLQARRIAKRLAALPIDAVYSSDLLRAKQTAEEIIRYQDRVDLVTYNDLRERYFGEWEGLFYDRVIERFPDFSPGMDFGGKYGIETIEDLQNRGFNRLAELSSLHPEQHIVIVSHGALINSVLYRLSEGKYGTGKSKLKNTCLNHLCFEDDRWVIHAVNDASHLDDEEAFKEME